MLVVSFHLRISPYVNMNHLPSRTAVAAGLSMIFVLIPPLSFVVLSGDIRFARLLFFSKMLFWFSASKMGMIAPVFVQNSDLLIVLNVIPLAFLTMLFYPVYTERIKEKAVAVYLSIMTGLFAIELYGSYILVLFASNAGP